MPYASVGKANPAIQGIDPPVTLAQANGIAAIADKLEKEGGVKSAWAVAISSFKKSHKVEGGKWVKGEGSKFGGKAMGDFVGRLKATLVGEKQDDVVEGKGAFTCECLKCGHTMKTDEHCVDVKCPECGGEMRREDRPGPGKFAGAGVKAIETDGGKYLVLRTSNAFEDREREIFSTKAWKDYVDRVGSHPEISPGRVWFWHVKGSDFADIVWQDVAGRMLVEVAKVDNTERGDKMFHVLQHTEEYPELLPQGLGTSHGYLYKGGDKESGVYGFVHKFETTILPFHRASNIYGGVMEVLDMTVSAEKQAALVDLFGDEEAANIIAGAKRASQELEAMGVAFKAKGDDEGKKVPPKKAKKVPPFIPDEDEDEDEDEEEEEGEKESFYELEMDDALLTEIAKHVDVGEQVKVAVGKALRAQRKAFTIAVKEAVAEANLGSKEQIVQQALAGKLRLIPHVASKSDDNVVSEKEIKEEQQKLGESDKSKQQPDVVAAVVQRMLAGH